MKVGDYVVVVVDHPDGVERKTFGEFGRIVDIVNDDITVNTINHIFVYGENQLRLATDEEIKLALDYIFEKGI